MVLGGNQKSQERFYHYMVHEDKDNSLLQTLREMLLRNFELTKKFLTEKNAALEMIFKIKQRRKLEDQTSGNKDGDEFEDGEGEIQRRDSAKVSPEAGDEDDEDKDEGQGGDELDDMLELNDAPKKDDEGMGNPYESNIQDAPQRQMSDRSEGGRKKKQSAEVEPSADMKEKTLRMTIRILRFLQLLCEGHFSQLQDHLRE